MRRYNYEKFIYNDAEYLGSGKSTWLRNNITNKDSVIISRDAIRFDMLKENEPYFSKEKEVYKEFIRQIDEALQNDKEVWVDQTSLTHAARYKLLQSIHQKPDMIVVYYIKCSLETAIRRNSKRSGRARVPEDVIKNMYEGLEEVTRDEGISYIVIEND